MPTSSIAWVSVDYIVQTDLMAVLEVAGFETAWKAENKPAAHSRDMG